MKISYYPGCTLKTNAKNFEDSAIKSLEKLGVELAELDRWNCCGTVFSFASDDVMYHLAPTRNLIRVKESGDDKVAVLCSMCYNTLKRANILINSDETKRNKLNDFMYREEIEYEGDVEVYHLLTLLKELVGLDKISDAIENPLEGLTLAPYYGCLLVRPEEAGIDDAENPSIFEDFIEAMGAEAVDFPYKTECCGAYQTVNDSDIVCDRTYSIVMGAHRFGADAIVLSCPLCDFNLDHRQEMTAKKYSDFKPMPVFYLTELLAVAMGLGFEKSWARLHYVDPLPILNKQVPA